MSAMIDDPKRYRAEAQIHSGGNHYGFYGFVEKRSFFGGGKGKAGKTGYER